MILQYDLRRETGLYPMRSLGILRLAMQNNESSIWISLCLSHTLSLPGNVQGTSMTEMACRNLQSRRLARLTFFLLHK